MTTQSLKLTNFVRDYKQAKGKEEEALAILEALCKIEENTRVEIDASEKKMVHEISLKDFATKRDLAELELRFDRKLHDVVNGAKWQVIGIILLTFIGSVLSPIVLQHFGV